MYSEWVSLRQSLQNDCSNRSVLENFSPSVGRDVAHAVVKNLVQQGIPDHKLFKSTQEVDWAMEVLCYGLTLPMNEKDGEIIKGCVNVYLEWLSVLSKPKRGIPEPILKEPNRNSQKIFQHLRNLFVPRESGNLALQASLCIRVLQTLQTLTSEGTMSPETWESLLRFLLMVNDMLLSQPYTPGKLSEHLREILISILLEVWLRATAQCFPSPSLWKTLQELCMSWRHHSAMIDHWSKTVQALTRRVIRHLYGTLHPLSPLVTKRNDVHVPPDLVNEGLVQSWFRILHIIGNPVDLCNVEAICDTPKFKEFALASEEVVSPSAHPCLRHLPEIFLQAMRGTAELVDSFLCVNTTQDEPVKHTPIEAPAKGATPTSSRKRYHKSLSIGLSLGLADNTGLNKRALTLPSRHSSGATSSGTLGLENNPVATSTMPMTSLFSKCPSVANIPSGDSVLHLFGSWLFDAVFVKVKMKDTFSALAKVYDSFVLGSNQQPPSSLQNTSSESSRRKESIIPELESFEPGRAEAYGALCRIFCSHRSGQEIRPVYLSRFYMALAAGLIYNEHCKGHILCSILLNSADLLRVDLQGVQVLLPHLLSALQIVLPRNNLKLRCEVNMTELRRAAIHLLVSMLCLPLHFQTLPIQDMTASWRKMSGQQDDGAEQTVTFSSLKPRLIRLLLDALNCEADSFNVQILLGGALLIIQDGEMAEFQGLLAQDNSTIHVDTELLMPPAQSRGRASSGESSASETGSVSINEPEVEGKPPEANQQIGPDAPDLSTVCGLFIQLTHLLCNKLVVMRSSQWKSDVHITLASFDVLSGLAQLSMDHLDNYECKSIIHWLGDYIEHQVSKPSRQHKRDMHSMIVAAFCCLQSWIMSHPWLMDSQSCLQVVMEVVELGISGSKSKGAKELGQKNASVTLKGDKELKLVSFRVREAAEGLLTTIMEHLRAFPSPCGPAATSSLLDEESLLEYANRGRTAQEKVDGRFRYFVMRDNSSIIALLEESLESEDSLPTVTAVSRSPTGRRVWTMQLRHFSREKENLLQAQLSDPGRPRPDPTQPKPHTTTKHTPFPESVEAVPLTKADKSIPELDDILDDRLSEVQDHMRNLMEKQAEHEAIAQAKADREAANLQFPSPDTEKKPPKPCEKFNPARLLLSHLGLLTLEGLKGNPLNPSEDASLVALDSACVGFHSALRDLDRLATRTQDTVLVFYVKNGQHDAGDIIENELNSCKHGKAFVEFLHSLGWPVDLASHPGWDGNIRKAWTQGKDDDENATLRDSEADLRQVSSMSTITESESDTEQEQTDGIVFQCKTPTKDTNNGPASLSEETDRSKNPDTRELDQILYFADVSCEVAFVIPALLPRYQRLRRIPAQVESSDEETADSQHRVARETRSGSAGTLGSASSNSLESRNSLSRQASEGPAVPEVSRTWSVDSKPLPKLSPHNTSSETNVVVAWLDQFDDHAYFPVDDVLADFEFTRESRGGLGSTSLLEKETVVIFIHPLRSGLYRIHTRATIRSPVGGPLVDGMVVSRRTLGSMVRQTAINVCRRRRLEIDTYSPPQVCRKLKIENIVKKYRHELSVPEFYVSLFATGDESGS